MPVSSALKTEELKRLANEWREVQRLWIRTVQLWTRCLRICKGDKEWYRKLILSASLEVEKADYKARILEIEAEEQGLLEYNLRKVQFQHIMQHKLAQRKGVAD